MSGKHRICPVQDYMEQKNRSEVKTMNLGPDKLMISKQDTIENIEVNRVTRCNLFTRNHT
jgi:hypothetical protein